METFIFVFPAGICKYSQAWKQPGFLGQQGAQPWKSPSFLVLSFDFNTERIEGPGCRSQNSQSWATSIQEALGALKKEVCLLESNVVKHCRLFCGRIMIGFNLTLALVLLG